MKLQTMRGVNYPQELFEGLNFLLESRAGHFTPEELKAMSGVRQLLWERGAELEIWQDTFAGKKDVN